MFQYILLFLFSSICDSLMSKIIEVQAKKQALLEPLFVISLVVLSFIYLSIRNEKKNIVLFFCYSFVFMQVAIIGLCSYSKCCLKLIFNIIKKKK